MSSLVGRTLGPYRLEAPLGKGGMAQVFRAYQASVGRFVAVKVMAPEIANEPGFIERFEREARVIASLEHPHILPIIDHGEAEGLHYIVMRYIDGGSLDDKLRQGRFNYEQAGKYLTQIASALDFAHRRGVIHRDLKPNNVLLDNSDNCYLTDFGIARVEGSERKLTATGSVMGTPAYMAPEQAMGRTVDARSDVYTLGVMLYEMVTGKLPFSGDTPAALIFQHVYEQPVPPRQLRPDLPDGIVAVLDRALAKSPDTRFQSAMDMANSFAEAIGQRPATSQRPAPSRGDFDKTVVGPDAPTGAPVARQVETQSPTQPPAPPPPGPVPAHSTPSPTEAVTVPIRRRGPLALFLGVLALVVLGVGGALVVTNNNNQAATETARAVVLALSATVTPSNTAEVTATPTATLTPSATNTPSETATITLTPSQTPTSTSSPTETPNGTETAFAVRMITIEAFSARETRNAQTEVAQTATQQAVILALSATLTPSNTPSVTPSITPTDTPSPTPTENMTETALAERIATIEAFNTRQAAIEATQAAATATALAAQTTATAEAAVQLTSTSIALTVQAVFEATLTALAPTITPTSAATQTPTRTPQPEFDPLATLTAQALLLTPIAINPTVPPGGLDALISGDPDTIFAALQEGSYIPADARIYKVPVEDLSPTVVGNFTKENIFYLQPFSRARFYNFVFSADVAISSSEKGEDLTSCGMYYNASNENYDGTTLIDADMLSIYLFRTQRYRLDKRQDNSWGDRALISDDTTAITARNQARNRLTVVVVDNRLWMFVNGVQLLNGYEEASFQGGTLGYFMIRGVTGATERCDFSNVNIWRLN